MVDVFDAVVLSELLLSRGARRVLLSRDSVDTSHRIDQRRTPDPTELVARVYDCRNALGAELTRAQFVTERHLRRSAQNGFQVVPFGDDQYPRRLAEIPEPPPVLWVAGARGLCGPLAVALVGSRAGSTYACTVAEKLGSDLSDRGVTVVSGLARGVDGAAHRGGLKGLGGTVGVLGCGLDVVYPPEHRDLIGEIRSRGSVVSEHGPSVPPRRFHFPRRNRVISGLSAAVVVVEAADRSGSLITARCAAEQGREVMAVPGSVLTGRNRGGHALIRDGAKVVETADDILEEIGIQAIGGHFKGAEDVIGADPILRHMDAGQGYDLDALVACSGLESAEILVRLVDCELKGLVRRSETGQFCRLRG